jgi:hypothetical protein
MERRTILALILAFVVYPVSGFSQKPPRGEYVPGELLVKFRSEEGHRSAQSIHHSFGSLVKKRFTRIKVDHIQIPEGWSLEEALAMYRRNPEVEYVEPNYRRRAFLETNDPDFDSLWGLHNTGQNMGVADVDIDAPEAWDILTDSSSVIIAILDTGVDLVHDDLAENIWINTNESIASAYTEEYPQDKCKTFMLNMTSRSHPFLYILIATFFTLISLSQASADHGILQIQSTTSVKVTGNLMQIEVTATNSGSAPSYGVRAHIITLGEKKSSPMRGQLNRAQSETFYFGKTIPQLKKGSYPLITRVTFHDSNNYPFSAVSCTTLTLKEDSDSDLLCSGDNVLIEENGLLRFSVHNKGPSTRTIQASLILPDELSTPLPQRGFLIEPGMEETLIFEISNFSALSGARYPAFCIFEYETEDIHHAKVCESLVEIVETENWFQRTQLFWLWAAIILGVIFVACQFKRKGS